MGLCRSKMGTLSHVESLRLSLLLSSTHKVRRAVAAPSAGSKTTPCCEVDPMSVKNGQVKMRIFGFALFIVTLVYLLLIALIERSIKRKYPEYWRSLGRTYFNSLRLSDLLSRKRLPPSAYENHRTVIIFVKTLLIVQFAAFPILAFVIYLSI